MTYKNILFIVADQFRGDTLGCAGHGDIKTPYLDALAARGTLFTKAHTPNPICVPARATMITGKYSHRATGTKNNAGRIGEDHVKLPELLAGRGFSTYASGKLHYVPYAAPGEERLTHGFQRWNSAESGRILKEYDPQGRTRGVEDYFDYLADAGWAGYSRAHGVGNNDIHPAVSPLPEEHQVDAWVATRAIDYLNEHKEANPNKPFFLNVGFPKPHSPYDPSPRAAALYDPRKIQGPAENRDGGERTPASRVSAIRHGQGYMSPQALQVMRAYYYGLITFQDEQVGRILKALDELGLAEETLIVFTADHGDMMGDFGFHFKSCMYEGSTGIPFILAGPGIPAGETRDALAGLQDLFPTVCDYLGLEIPSGLDGESLLPVIRGESEGRDYFVSYSLDDPNQTAMVTDGRLKYIYNELGGVEELYDLAADPREETNRAGDPALADDQARLKDYLVTWAGEKGDDRLLEGKGLKQSPPVNYDEVEFQAGAMGWRWY